MRKSLLAFVLAASPMLAPADTADINMRPGLWEIAVSSDLLWLVPQIPPEQMQSLQELAEQYGVDIPQVQMGEAISKACITHEMADQKQLPIFYQAQLGCTSTNATRDRNKYSIDFVCNGPQLQGKGTAQGMLNSPESFSGRTKFEGVAQGNPLNEHADIRGRWMSAGCGTVRPL